MRAIIARAELFPPELLDDMIAPFLTGGAPAERWRGVEADGALAGFAYCAPERMTDGTFNLLLIAVDPARQGQGIGTALMRGIERGLRGEGVRILLVETSGLPEFAATRRFYAGLGYDEEARIRDFYRTGEDKIVFRLALGGAG